MRLPDGPRVLLASSAAPTAAFAIVQTVLAGIDLGLTAVPMMFDVTNTYRAWADQWFQHSVLVGVDTPWVYPVVALVPMIAAGLFGDGGYGIAWLAIVALLNVVAVNALAVRSRAAAWWWVAFTACLGPIALGRIDAISLPLAIMGVLLLARHPAAASVLLTVATWVKVWPAAVLLAAFFVLRSRWRVVAGAAACSTVIVAVVLLLGGGGNLLSAGSMQAGRGVQVEAPVALPWLWLAHLRPRTAGSSRWPRSASWRR